MDDLQRQEAKQAKIDTNQGATEEFEHNPPITAKRNVNGPPCAQIGASKNVAISDSPDAQMAA